jgi:hypothetical protein
MHKSKIKITTNIATLTFNSMYVHDYGCGRKKKNGSKENTLDIETPGSNTIAEL